MRLLPDRRSACQACLEPTFTIRIYVQDVLIPELLEHMITVGRLDLRDLACLSATCKGMRALLQPRQISCTQPASVLQLAAAARHWKCAEQIRLPLQDLVIGTEDTPTLNNILGRALDIPNLRGLQLLESPAKGCRKFQVMLRDLLLEAPSLQVLHLHAARVLALPRLAFMHLHELKLEVSKSLSSSACTSLCQVSTLQMMFLSYNSCGGGNLAIDPMDLRGLEDLIMVGLDRLAPEQFKLPERCIFVFNGYWESLTPILQDVRTNLHRVHTGVARLGSDAFRHLDGEHVCRSLSHIFLLAEHVGTLQQPVVFQLPCLRVLRLVTDGSLHVSLQGALPQILDLRTVHQTEEEIEASDEVEGAGNFSLHITDVAALASNLEEMHMSYRNLQGPELALTSLLELLARRQADVNCGAFRNPQGGGQAEYYFVVKRWCQEGLATSMAYACLCRACRWGFLDNGPFNEYTYHTPDENGQPQMATEFNDLDALESELHALGSVIKPGFELPTA